MGGLVILHSWRCIDVSTTWTTKAWLYDIEAYYSEKNLGALRFAV